MSYEGRWKTVKVEIEEGIAWVTFNRPEKRNAMSPTFNHEMREVLEGSNSTRSVRVLVLTGEGDCVVRGDGPEGVFPRSRSKPESYQEKIRRDASEWQWKLLRMYAKPTIAMVNGWCFGGAFSPLVACDLAIAAETAVFGLSEINWGIPPGNLVSKAMADTVGHRKALEYIMTGDTFTGSTGGGDGLVNKAVPLEKLREETILLAKKLIEQERGCPARSQARLQALPRADLGAERGLPLRQARPGPASRSRAWPRTGNETVSRRKEHQAWPASVQAVR